MKDFVDIFSQCEQKVAETISFNPNVTDLVKVIEARSDTNREYGDTFQSLLEAYKINELPAMVVSVDRLASSADNNTTAQDNYHIKCAVVTITTARTLQESLAKAQKIIHYLELVIKEQRSSVQTFNDFGGYTEVMPVTQFENSEFNNKYITVATTEFTILSIQEFVIT